MPAHRINLVHLSDVVTAMMMMMLANDAVVRVVFCTVCG